MSTSYTEQEHEAKRAQRDDESRAYGKDTSTRSIGQLVADATQDVSSIIRNEIQLAKSEITADVSKIGKGVGMFAGAGVFAFLALIILLIAAGLGLAEFMPGWLAFLIVAVVLLVVAGILALVGKGAISKAKFKPERTIRNAQETVEALKPARSTETGPVTHPRPTAASAERAQTTGRVEAVTTAGAADGAHKASV